MKFKINKKVVTLLMTTPIAVGLFALNSTVLAKYTTLTTLLSLVTILILLAPFIAIQYRIYDRRKQLEANFPVFLRDFVESVRGGMTIPHSIKNVSNNDYRALSPYVKKMAAQLDWGIPVTTVLLRFSKEAKSKVISRIIFSVVESHRFGGNLVDTFEALANTAIEVEHLRAERRLYLQSQMITGYIIFFVFLAVMLGLQQFLVPSLTQVSPIGVLTGGASQEGLASEYKVLFRNLIIIQGLFAGLTVGKMAEGSMFAGIKHSLFMVFVGTVVFYIFS